MLLLYERQVPHRNWQNKRMCTIEQHHVNNNKIHVILSGIAILIRRFFFWFELSSVPSRHKLLLLFFLQIPTSNIIYTFPGYRTANERQNSLASQWRFDLDEQQLNASSATAKYVFLVAFNYKHVFPSF